MTAASPRGGAGSPPGRGCRQRGGRRRRGGRRERGRRLRGELGRHRRVRRHGGPRRRPRGHRGHPQPYTPSETAYVDGPAPASYVAFDVTVTNGTGADYEPVGLFPTLQSGSTEEAQVSDSEQGLDGTPYTTLLPGRSVCFRVGSGASAPDDLVLELWAGFDHESVVSTS
ncbi:hypothetical protein [Geodermatophilus sp. SYSU D01119]